MHLTIITFNYLRLDIALLTNVEFCVHKRPKFDEIKCAFLRWPMGYRNDKFSMQHHTQINHKFDSAISMCIFRECRSTLRFTVIISNEYQMKLCTNNPKSIFTILILIVYSLLCLCILSFVVPVIC